MWVLLPALLTVTMGWRWEREGVQIKSTVVTALLPPGSTLTFDTDESILRPNALFVFFSLRHSPSHLTSPLCGLTCTFSRSSPPPPTLCVFSLSSGRQLHAEALWITELQDTVSENCSVFFFSSTKHFSKALSRTGGLIWCCNSRLEFAPCAGVCVTEIDLAFDALLI